MTKIENSVSMGFEAGFFCFLQVQRKISHAGKDEMNSLPNSNSVLVGRWA